MARLTSWRAESSARIVAPETARTHGLCPARSTGQVCPARTTPRTPLVSWGVTVEASDGLAPGLHAAAIARTKAARAMRTPELGILAAREAPASESLDSRKHAPPFSGRTPEPSWPAVIRPQ